MERMSATAEEILDGLDEAQRAAATAVDGPVRIIAGAGAGKTRTVARRIAYACATKAWNPRSTIAVTFSVKAAAEMRSRLSKLDVAADVKAATFHSAALHQLRQVWPDVCEGPMPFISRNPRELVERSLRRVTTFQVDDDTIRNLQAEINWCKISLIAPEDYARVCAATHRQPPSGLEPSQFVDVYKAYEAEKTNRNEIDFDDILLIVCHLMESDEEVASAIRSNIRWLTVDEYQDVSPLQHRLLTRWLGSNRNICVVGDPAQTIYSFAGASSYSLLNFDSEFGPLTADINLNNDYRSTPQIVSYANRVLAASPQRADYLKLSSERSKGRRVVETIYGSDWEEAQGVAARIRKLVDAGESPTDCAILTRVNAQQKILCKALAEQHLRYRVRRDSGWQNSALSDDTQTRLAMLEALGVGADLSGVTISTIHASKGLEFKHVFLIGCSEGLIPYGLPQDDDVLEEERRLMYVAVTRAEDTLDVSYARTREGNEGERARRVSRFFR
ncbi:ATP-dependent helicase [Bifidobacterium pseudocatenulatum]|uniref:ATP-dependent helicase n=1 Tax=Bifidobacterium pseudocatenulatum TaxID=28026 RepID=UPI000E42DA2B|nr:ATP-dependent helicase [Bifidobacterium pseudocatenulatum]RGN30484.1 ATP-dependent helicase [Bifidobacterium pseudocatenulatum]